jgi:chemotaxis protein MotB
MSDNFNGTALNSGQFDADFEENGDDSKEWMVTFTDMCLLLLVFFILLFTMSTLDDTRFKESFLSVRMALGDVMGGSLGADKVPVEDLGVFIDQVMVQRQIVENQKKVFSDFRYFQNSKGLEGVVGAVFDEGTITLRVPGDVLFSSGQVSLTPEGKKLLRNSRNFSCDTMTKSLIFVDLQMIYQLQEIPGLRIIGKFPPCVPSTSYAMLWN